MRGKPSSRSELSAGSWQQLRQPELPAASSGEVGPWRGHKQGPLLPVADGEGSPASSIENSTEVREWCCPHSVAGRKNPVSKSWPHGCKVCLCSLPLSALELTHHWPCFPAKLGALALPVPCSTLSWFLHTCFSLCNTRAVRHTPQEHCDA